MTGEMSWDDLKDYPDMIRLTKCIQKQLKISAELRPFDQYQGPFIAIDLNGKPLRGKGRNEIGSWNVEVWQADYDLYTVNHREKFSEPLFCQEIINYIADLKGGKR